MTTSSTSPNGQKPAAKPAAARLRELLADPSKIIVAPGVYDGLTARIALREGFDCLYMTGAGTSASLLGSPDLGLLTLDAMLSHARTLASLSRPTPLIADADTGYGGPLMISRTVQGYMAAGVAGLHLEDQIVQKRCGHLAGKEIVAEDVWESRIRAAVLARADFQQTSGGGDVVLIARTDALQSQGYEIAVGRLKSAVALGADVAFLEGVTSKEMAGRVVRDMAPTPCLLNIVPGGVTPEMNVKEAQELGFGVVIFPCFALEPVYHGVTRAARELRESGELRNVEEGCQGIKEVFRVCGLDECVAFDGRAGERVMKAESIWMCEGNNGLVSFGGILAR